MLVSLFYSLMILPLIKEITLVDEVNTISFFGVKDKKIISQFCQIVLKCLQAV